MYIQKSYKDQKNSFYIIPTPIGNLEDITIRAINILKKLDILYCEDTRITKRLLKHFEIKVSLKIYNDHSEDKKKEEILEKIKEGKIIGLVSDAGMPGISDPGFKLIDYLKKNKQNVVVLPGPCAFIEPMVYFAKDNNPFIYRGFLSKHKTSYKNQIKEICKENYNTIIYESPHRIAKTLKYIKEQNLENNVLIAREISKIYESYIDGNVSKVLEYVQSNPLKGEIVLIIGIPNIKNAEVDYMTMIKEYGEKGVSLKDACKIISEEYGLSKNKVYNEYIKKSITNNNN